MPVYLYGVVRDGHSLPGDLVGVEATKVGLVSADALAAVVSVVDDPLLPRRRNLFAHMEVLERVMSGGAVLPFRFGTLLPAEAAVQELLAEDQQRFLQLLSELDGMVQVTVKARHDEDAVIREALQEDRQLAQLNRQTREGRAGIDLRIELGQRLAAAVDAKQARDAHEVLRRLQPLAASSVPEDTRDAVVSVALLVPEDRLADVDAAVTELHDAFGHRLSIEYAGPMPAYSFMEE